MENPNLKWMITRGIPILGNLHFHDQITSNLYVWWVHLQSKEYEKTPWPRMSSLTNSPCTSPVPKAMATSACEVCFSKYHLYSNPSWFTYSIYHNINLNNLIQPLYPFQTIDIPTPRRLRPPDPVRWHPAGASYHRIRCPPRDDSIRPAGHYNSTYSTNREEKTNNGYRYSYSYSYTHIVM